MNTVLQYNWSMAGHYLSYCLCLGHYFCSAHGLWSNGTAAYAIQPIIDDYTCKMYYVDYVVTWSFMNQPFFVYQSGNLNQSRSSAMDVVLHAAAVVSVQISLMSLFCLHHHFYTVAKTQAQGLISSGHHHWSWFCIHVHVQTCQLQCNLVTVLQYSKQVRHLVQSDLHNLETLVP